jgi:lysine N6-hydroxylase
VKKQRKWVRLLPHRTVNAMSKHVDGFNLAVKNTLTGLEENYTGTVIILATGFETKLPQCLAPIMDDLVLCDDGLLQLDQNFKVRWQGNPNNSIYAVNAGLGSHGIADPQLSLAAWRAAKIINDVAGESFFDITESANVMEWGSEIVMV